MKLAANILSIIFHPLLMITYGVLLALTYTTLAIYPMQLKLWVLAGVFMMTAFVPALFIFLMIKIGKNGDYELTNRTDRTMPYLVYIASVIACVLYLSKMLMPVWVLSLVFGTAVAMLIAMCINFFWKISAHMIGIGGLLGGIMGISRVYLLNPYWAFIIVLTSLRRIRTGIYKYLYIFIIKLFLFFHLKHKRYEFSNRCKVHKGS